MHYHTAFNIISNTSIFRPGSIHSQSSLTYYSSSSSTTCFHSSTRTTTITSKTFLSRFQKCTFTHSPLFCFRAHSTQIQTSSASSSPSSSSFKSRFSIVMTNKKKAGNSDDDEDESPISKLAFRVTAVLVALGFVAYTFLPFVYGIKVNEKLEQAQQQHIVSSVKDVTKDDGALANPFQGVKLSAAVAKKLKAVPVFTVTDPQGVPYLSVSKTNPNQRIGLLYMDPTDAYAYLNLIKNENSDIDVDAKVFVLALDEAVQLASKQTNLEAFQDRFLLVPEKAQRDKAAAILGGDLEPDVVPVFYVPGLATNPNVNADSLDGASGSAQSFPLFLGFRELDVALNREQKKYLDSVQVLDLAKTLAEMTNKPSQQNQSVYFVPTRDAVQEFKRLKSSA